MVNHALKFTDSNKKRFLVWAEDFPELKSEIISSRDLRRFELDNMITGIIINMKMLQNKGDE